MLTALKTANLGLAFGLELCMLAALAFWGVRAGNSVAAKLALGIGAPLAAIVIWGLFMAPQATFTLPTAAHTALFVAIFGVAAIALGSAGQPILAVIFAVISALNYILASLWH